VRRIPIRRSSPVLALLRFCRFFKKESASPNSLFTSLREINLEHFPCDIYYSPNFFWVGSQKIIKNGLIGQSQEVLQFSWGIAPGYCFQAVGLLKNSVEREKRCLKENSDQLKTQ